MTTPTFKRTLNRSASIVRRRWAPLLGVASMGLLIMVGAVIAGIVLLMAVAPEGGTVADVRGLAIGVGAITGLLMIGPVIAGVSVAFGSGVVASLRHGLASILLFFTQLLIILRIPVAVALVLAALYGGDMLPGPLGLVGVAVVWALTFVEGGRATAAMGAIAAGDRSARPAVALTRLHGSRALSGFAAVFLVSLLVGGLGLVPLAGQVLGLLLGMVVSPAVIAAFYLGTWGDDEEPRVVLRQTHARTHTFGSAPRDAVPTAGPAFVGRVTSEEPWQTSIVLDAPGRIALDLTWTRTLPPEVRVCDHRGEWVTPEGQPTGSERMVWLDLGAGETQLSVGPSSTQPISIRAQTWLPEVEALTA